MTDGAIRIDGVIDSVWTSADSAADFFQLQPYFNKPPSVRTVAKILTSTDALYCLMICYDSLENIQQGTGVLDQTTGDIVSIMLDTFNDRQTAYKFAVTASGVRADCRLLDDARNRDYSWDGVWFADSKIYDWGFVVEMKIPYRSLHYDKSLTEWGLDFDRWSPLRHEDLYWCSYAQDEGQRISKFGKLLFRDFQPAETGLNLEVYPVGIDKTTWLHDSKYSSDISAGIDIFYNPSEKLTFQLTGNPDFAQIEADPFAFNISRYETHYDERRPFFTEGNEIFMASGRERNSGFYTPLELFYSRRIGKLLPDRSEVPLVVGTKAFGRLDDWQYGGFLAIADPKNYLNNGERVTEERAYFGSARLMRQVFENSTMGMLFVGKRTKDSFDGVIDIDGAFRTSNIQLAYQMARSVQDGHGDYASSFGFKMGSKTWWNAARLRAVGKDFDVSEVGYVPWKGTVEFTALSGPIWYYESGTISQIQFYAGPSLFYQDAELYTDHAAVLGINMQFRSNWGYEIDLTWGKSKDSGVRFTSYEADFSSWYNISPVWDANLWGGYSQTYNFSRNYQAFYTWMGINFDWKPLSILGLGTSYNMYVEGNPRGSVEDITYNARPYVSLSPINDLTLRVYVDNTFVKSSDRVEQVLFGSLLSYNFLPKSWVYFAINEAHDRSDETDRNGILLPRRLHLVDRAAVLKVKYLYYF